ncbi:MAG TPA: DUF2071 domain-containing protein [Flavobacteriales bacterium]|nr:DUF2071 domain-containing protein [Flavobacteriales bacterium]
MSRPFLTAHWRRLALVNYVVDPEVLQPFLPAGTELDRWNGHCYVSLVGFVFRDTRLRGLPIPYHRHFEEVNLRFYVTRREGDEVKRGVVFVQEIVPRPALTWVARTIYKEPYRTMPMEHVHRERDGDLFVSYSWHCGQRRHVLKMVADLAPQDMSPGSEAEFITEHYWGYTRVAHDHTREYEVRHPRWRVHGVRHHALDVDLGRLYGPRFAFLNDQAPASVLLAEGSPVQVMNGRKLRLHPSARS